MWMIETGRSWRNGLFAISLAALIMAGAASGQDKPIWKFTILASIDSVFVEQFGGLENCRTLIGEQLDAVNHIYNDSAVFAGTFAFTLDSLKTFTGAGVNLLHEPHPGQDYHIIYDFDTRTLFNWAYPPDNAVLFRTYSNENIPFPFFAPGNLVLAHELAHSRGAVDLYGLEVDGSLNQVNGQSFSPQGSMMADLTLGVWSEHTQLVVNKNGGAVLSLTQFRLALFPSQIIIRVVDRSGRPIPDADIRVYGHTWYGMAVSSLELAAGRTGDSGEFFLDPDIFVGSDSVNFCPNTLCVKYPTLLLRVVHGLHREFVWLPFTSPQVHSLRNEPGPYIRTVEMSEGNPAVPESFTLSQNYPNPFNSETSICLTVRTAGNLKLEITNVLGQIEAVIHDGPVTEGTRCFTWAGQASSGIYLCRATLGGSSQAVKMLLLK